MEVDKTASFTSDASSTKALLPLPLTAGRVRFDYLQQSHFRDVDECGVLGTDWTPYTPPSLISCSAPVSVPITASPVMVLVPNPTPPKAAPTSAPTVFPGDANYSNGTVVIESNTIINGSLTVAPGVTVSIRGNVTLQVLQCASFAGALEVIRQAPDQTVLNGRLEVINFNGFCNGSQSEFSSATLQFTGQPPCAKSTGAQAVYSPVSVSLLFNYDTSECNSALSTGAIAGIAVGVIVVALIIGLILVLKFTNVIRPFSGKKINNHAELD
jgi:hypothetical protein